MKFIHIADVHLGMHPEKGEPWGEGRDRELWETFDAILARCNEEEIDLLLIAGDLFHRQPLVKELKEVNYRFSKLTHTKVVLIAGNHDYLGVRSHARDFAWAEQVVFLREDTLTSVEFPELATTVYGLSYPTRDVTEAVYDTAKPAQKEGFHILLAHGGDAKDAPMDYRRIAAAGFDYVALGHIHKPGQMAERMWYAGSPEPLDKNETGVHGYVSGTLQRTERGSVLAAELVPFSKREYRTVSLAVTAEDTSGSVCDRVETEIAAQGRQHFYKVELLGAKPDAVEFDLTAIRAKGRVLTVTDRTRPDYDFDALYGQNRDNLLGMFIARIRALDEDEAKKEKALYYGVEALLAAKR